MKLRFSLADVSFYVSERVDFESAMQYTLKGENVKKSIQTGITVLKIDIWGGKSLSPIFLRPCCPVAVKRNLRPYNRRRFTYPFPSF